MRNFFALTCAGLMFVICAGMPASADVLTDQPTVTTEQAGWMTYTNTVFGFSIAYPSTMQLKTYKDVQKQQELYPFCNFVGHNVSLVMCFYLPQGAEPRTESTLTGIGPGGNYTVASLAVSTSNLDQQDCLSFADDSFAASLGIKSQHTTNAIYFSTYTAREDVWPGWHTNTYSRAFIRDTCFELTMTIARTDYQEFAPTVTPISEPDSDPKYQFVQVIFDQMLMTFRIIPLEQHAVAANPSQAAPTSTLMAGWKLYTNSVFGFSFAYPPTMQLKNYQNCASEAANSSLVICVYLPTGTYPDTTNTDFLGAVLAISTANLNEQDCLSFSQDPEFDGSKPKQTTINGIKYFTVERAGVATGNFRVTVSNRTFTNNTCFHLTITIAGAFFAENTVWTSTPTIKPFTETNLQNVRALFEQVLATLHFTSLQASTVST